MNNIVFFNTENNKRIFMSSIRIIEDNLISKPEEGLERQRLEHLRVILIYMNDEVDSWDHNCQYSIEVYSKKFINHLLSISQNQHIDDQLCQLIYSYSFLFLQERNISTAGDLPSELIDALDFVKNNIDSFNSLNQPRLLFALRDLPTYLFKKIFNSPQIKSLRSIESTIASAERFTKDWNARLEEREKSAQLLESSVKKFENAFNFVGLSEGFNTIGKKKHKEKNRLLIALSVLAFLIIAPLLIKIIYLIFNPQNNYGFSYILKDGYSSSNMTNTIEFLIAAISYIAVMLYFFRVVHFNYKSVCAQIIQIELRITLCEFILHYSENAKKIHDNSAPTLEKFESVIFSGLVANEGDIPATFDGLEQIGSLVKSIKG